MLGGINLSELETRRFCSLTDSPTRGVTLTAQRSVMAMSLQDRGRRDGRRRGGEVGATGSYIQGGTVGRGAASFKRSSLVSSSGIYHLQSCIVEVSNE